MVSSSSPSFREKFHHPASWQPAQVAAQGQQLEHSTGAGTHRGGPRPQLYPHQAHLQAHSYGVFPRATQPQLEHLQNLLSSTFSSK